MIVAYIAHPISGNVVENLAKVGKIVREINLTEPDVVPFVPYYVDCICMNDNIPYERARGIQNDKHLLESGVVDELRLYGDRISEGMKAEILLADKLRIPIVPMRDHMFHELDQFDLGPFAQNSFKKPETNP